jgi:hypothetical protein
MPSFRARALLLALVVGTLGACWVHRSYTPVHTPGGVYLTRSTDPGVRRAYEVAARRTELLEQLPCHCGCMKNAMKHSSNFDCFRTTHGETCPICVRTALYADRAVDEGHGLDEIRRYLKNVFEFELF